MSKLPLFLTILVFALFLSRITHAEPEVPNIFYSIMLDSPADADMDTIAQAQVLQLLSSQLQKDTVAQLVRKDWAPRGTATAYCIELRVQQKKTKENFESLLNRIKAGTDSSHMHWEAVKNCN